MPGEADERRRIRQRAGRFAVVRDGRAPCDAVPCLKRIAGKHITLAFDRARGGGSESIAVLVESIATGWLVALYTCQCCGNNDIRYRQLAATVEIARFVHYAVPCALLAGERRGIIAEIADRAGKAFGGGRVIFVICVVPAEVEIERLARQRRPGRKASTARDARRLVESGENGGVCRIGDGRQIFERFVEECRALGRAGANAIIAVRV